MNYIVTDTQLTTIANAIRAKKAIDPSESYASLGKNLLPASGQVSGLANGTYTFSAKATEAIEAGTYFSWLYGTQEEFAELPAVAAGERFSIPVTVSASVTLKFGNYYAEQQLEAGSDATAYEAYIVKIAFPDGFTSEIGELTNTSDANAAAGDIQSGKTAYVNGTKITGTHTLADDTSNATAVAGDIRKSKTAYVNGNLVTGNWVPKAVLTDETEISGYTVAFESTKSFPKSSQTTVILSQATGTNKYKLKDVYIKSFSAAMHTENTVRATKTGGGGNLTIISSTVNARGELELVLKNNGSSSITGVTGLSFPYSTFTGEFITIAVE